MKNEVGMTGSKSIYKQEIITSTIHPYAGAKIVIMQLNQTDKPDPVPYMHVYVCKSINCKT